MNSTEKANAKTRRMILVLEGGEKIMKESLTIADVRTFVEQQSYICEESPQILGEIGEGEVKLVVNVATHGNEVMPVIAAHHALSLLQRQQIDGRVRFTIANPPALLSNQRFVESDLNRIYPGRIDGSLEERLAVQMLPLVENVPYVVDMHTSPQTLPFVVAVKRTPQHLKFAEAMGITNIAFLAMKSEPHTLVEFSECGVGVELGPHADPLAIDQGINVVFRLMQYIGMLPGTEVENIEHQYFVMKGLLSRKDAARVPGGIQDLVPVKNQLLGLSPSNGVSYPILSDPKRTFSDHYCLLLDKVSRDYLAGSENRQT